MFTRILAFLALATLANANDVIVGLKTDGKKIFDENRQANPALWRQMDNVTIKAPENEVIRRVVITDLRPDKDGDVKVVEGGEGQKNVTIELKSPTVLRGYEFHIEVYSAPEENVPFTNDQQSTTAIVQDGSTASTSTNPSTNLDTTSKLPEFSTDKIVPAILSNDEVKDGERQGRNAKIEENNTSDATTELTSTTFKNDASTTQPTESATENRSEKSDTLNKFDHESTTSPVPLNKNFNNPAIPAISGKDIANEKLNVNGDTDTRHVRDTVKEKSELPTEIKLHPKDVGVQSTENNEEATTTETSYVIPVEEKSEDKDKEVQSQFNNRKYTSVISSKVGHQHSPIEAKDSEKLRNVRGTNDEQMVDGTSGTTTTPNESSTTEINDGTTTISSEDCITTEPTIIQNPANDKDGQGKQDPIPVYVNNRQWEQRFNNPTQVRDGQNAPGLTLYPAILPKEQSTITPETMDPSLYRKP